MRGGAHGGRLTGIPDLALQYLCHTMGGTKTADQVLQGYPFHGDAGIAETLLQGLRLSAYGHDVARGDCQEVVGIVHLVIMIDRDDFEAPSFDILNEGLVLFPEGIFLRARLTGPDVAGVVLRVAWQGLVAASDHRTEILVDDVEVGVEMHLHLPELMVAHDDNRVVTEGVGLHQLADALVVGAHAAAYERDVAGGDIVATLESAVAIDAEDGLQSEVLIAEFNDIGLRGALAAVHLADNVALRGGDALVAGEVEVHQRVLDIYCLVASIAVGFRELHRGL